jgi:hypothetical protein
MLSTQTRSFPVKHFICHSLVFLLFFVAWRYLSVWYVYRLRTDYILFASIFVAAILLSVWPLFHLVRDIKISRRFLILFLFLLILPWGEWVQRNFPNAREDWTRQIFKQVLLLYVLILILCSRPALLRRIADRYRNAVELVSASKFLLWLPPFLFFIISSVIAIFVFQKTPIVPDSASYLFQAKTFAEGRWVAEAPAATDFFNHTASLIAMKDGRWFSIYSPGFPLVLAPAILLGIEWLISPLLGAFSCVIWIAYAKRWHSVSVAVVMGWLFLLSPFLVLISATITAHSPELFFASAIIYLCRLETERPGLQNKIVLLFLLSLGILTRSFSMLAFLGPILAYSIWVHISRRSV